LTLPSWPRALIYELWCKNAAPTWMSRRTFAACSQLGAANPFSTRNRLSAPISRILANIVHELETCWIAYNLRKFE
jgi:hypothetical protein